MRAAVITDIHGNLPAREAVPARVREIGVDELRRGGDLIGDGTGAAFAEKPAVAA